MSPRPDARPDCYQAAMSSLCYHYGRAVAQSRILLKSSDWDAAAGATQIDRMLEVAESPQPAVEVAFVKNAQAFSLYVARRTADLESL